MRIDLKDILVLFEKIQQGVNIAYVSVAIFCAVDVDSLCTLKIFSVITYQYRNSLKAKIYNIRSILLLDTQNSSKEQKNQNLVIESNYFSSSIAEESSISQKVIYQKEMEQKYSFSMSINQSIIAIFKVHMYQSTH